MLDSGMQIGPYRILGPLGAGGMGEVYRAHDARLGRDVALKVLPPRFAEDVDRLSRFEREARAVGALAHPNIVVVYDFGTDRGVTFAVTELLEGETLQERLSQSTLPWRKAVELAVAVAEGLAAAHTKGIVHRDIKPGNIFITTEERVKILDFGLAKLFAEGSDPKQADTQSYSPVLTKAGTVLGTVPYMSPEQLRGQPVDARSDIFSLGCTLYEMVAGRRPFTGRTDADTRDAILHNDPADLTDSGKEAPVELERLIRRCLEKNPNARFQSARDLAFALTDITTRSKETKAATARSYWVLGLAAAAVVLAVGLGISLWSRNSPSTPIDLGKSAPAEPVAVAVLPFLNATKDPEADYLGDGLPSGVIKSLSEVGELRVRSFNTVSRFRGPNLDLEELARKLKVQAVLIGKILPHKDGFSLSVELVNVVSDSVLWTERYDVKPTEIQSIQLAIARQICASLKVRMTAEEEKRFAKRYSDNAEAYQLFLLGRYHFYKQNTESLKKAEQCFLQAIHKDRGYALAYAGLAEVYRYRGAKETPATRLEDLALAKKAAQMALHLDEELAEAHIALGEILLRDDWDWAGAEKEFKRAVQLNPSQAHVVDAYFGFALRMGRFKEAEEAMKKASQLDPITPYINNDAPRLHYFMRQYALAIQEWRKLLEVDPDFLLAYYNLGFAHAQLGQYHEGLAAFQKLRQLNDTTDNLALVAYGHAVGGDKEAARKILEELMAPEKQPFVAGPHFAFIHIALGEKDQACDWLEKAFAVHSGYLTLLKIEPVYDSLRSEPRFVALLKKMNFPDEPKN
jgi:eukaryotic-like serine/threonine-protein kinase